MKNADETRGELLVIDGPNGVGKTGVTALVAELLRKAGKRVFETREPTHRFKRSDEERHHGLELARLIVEDRRSHLELDIEPALCKGGWVVSDRYVCSSLVFRALDGVGFEETWGANECFRVPDLSVVLMARSDVIGNRLLARENLTRFERQHSSQEEVDLYKKASLFLRQRQYKICEVSNENRDMRETASEIVALMLAS